MAQSLLEAIKEAKKLNRIISNEKWYRSFGIRCKSKELVIEIAIDRMFINVARCIVPSKQGNFRVILAEAL